MKKGFTLLEIIVVIIIIGVLATLGFTQYTRVIEKGRTAEAKTILGQLRGAEIVRYQEQGAYTGLANLYVEAPVTCVTTHYFSYACAAATGKCTSTRCTAGGKTPNAAAPGYTIWLDASGVWGGTPGYF